jgi:hypothetical protein
MQGYGLLHNWDPEKYFLLIINFQVQKEHEFTEVNMYRHTKSIIRTSIDWTKRNSIVYLLVYINRDKYQINSQFHFRGKINNNKPSPLFLGKIMERKWKNSHTFEEVPIVTEFVISPEKMKQLLSHSLALRSLKTWTVLKLLKIQKPHKPINRRELWFKNYLRITETEATNWE